MIKCYSSPSLLKTDSKKLKTSDANQMLSDKLFHVHLNGQISNFRSLRNGLPQESVLDPV